MTELRLPSVAHGTPRPPPRPHPTQGVESTRDIPPLPIPPTFKNKRCPCKNKERGDSTETEISLRDSKGKWPATPLTRRCAPQSRGRLRRLPCGKLNVPLAAWFLGGRVQAIPLPFSPLNIQPGQPARHSERAGSRTAYGSQKPKLQGRQFGEDDRRFLPRPRPLTHPIPLSLATMHRTRGL